MISQSLSLRVSSELIDAPSSGWPGGKFCAPMPQTTSLLLLVDTLASSGSGQVKEQKSTLTVEEAARLLGISRGIAFQAVRRGDIPSIRIGRRILIPIARLHAMLDTETEQ